MLVTALGLLVVLAAALYVTWPLLAGVGAESDPEAESVRPAAGLAVEGDAARAALERDRDVALAAIKEADFDHRVGKLSDEDHAALRTELENRALRAISALEGSVAQARARSSGTPTAADAAPEEERSATAPAAAERRGRGTPRPAPGGEATFCAGCGRKNPTTARYCGGCGRPVDTSGERRRIRA